MIEDFLTIISLSDYCQWSQPNEQEERAWTRGASRDIRPGGRGKVGDPPTISKQVLGGSVLKGLPIRRGGRVGLTQIWAGPTWGWLGVGPNKIFRWIPNVLKYISETIGHQLVPPFSQNVLPRAIASAWQNPESSRGCVKIERQLGRGVCVECHHQQMKVFHGTWDKLQNKKCLSFTDVASYPVQLKYPDLSWCLGDLTDWHCSAFQAGQCQAGQNTLRHGRQKSCGQGV